MITICNFIKIYYNGELYDDNKAVAIKAEIQ